ncbi:MAG: T9SS type A sorting domain-containing protein [Bacteroidales bacterium]
MIINNLRHLVLLVLGVLWAGFVEAQESVNTSGSDATGSGGKVAYSIGQVFYTTNSNSSVSVVQGVQLAYEIFTIGINSTIFEISLTVFPNPTKDILILEISNFNSEKLYYQLCDMQGKMLNMEQIVTQHTHISLNKLSSATYFFNVVNVENKKVHSFKIIKN